MKYEYKSFLGKKFDRLLVVELVGVVNKCKSVRCICDCGKEKVVSIYSLMDGNISSCGCKQRESSRNIKYKNLLNHIFDYLTVIEEIGIKKKRTHWKCFCKCGNICIACTADLMRGSVTSCGCKKSPDITGKVYGDLMVVERGPQKIKNKVITWRCLCSCGNITFVSTAKLNNGHTRSCGCLTKLTHKKNHQWRGYEDISGKFFSEIKAGARKRNIEFDITIEEIWNLLIKQNFKCALSGLDIVLPKYAKDRTWSASLDRIDSSKGYTADNIQWVHKDINYLKMDFPEDRLIELCRKITEHQANNGNN